VQRTAIQAASLLLLPTSLCAQWPNVKKTGIPRTEDRKPTLTAPAPRTPDQIVSNPDRERPRVLSQIIVHSTGTAG
jgi:hypothetical protein